MKRTLTPLSLASRRGSALIMVVIILGVLALLGAAALRLAQQDSISVNQRITRQALGACAEAAQRKLLADVALRHGSTDGTATAVAVPGANTRLVIGHYDSDISVADVAIKENFFPLEAPATSGGYDDNDTTNTMRAQPLFGKAYRTYAHCTDGAGREFEVEVVVKWM